MSVLLCQKAGKKLLIIYRIKVDKTAKQNADPINSQKLNCSWRFCACLRWIRDFDNLSGSSQNSNRITSLC
ncbi:hypothetical protein ALO_01140 [Acetonema longum DSM 6540]|uniref:Uncharacterized protein n=1 Tax=Acetonema longum DSM 6540 TaxID=1009370 RepID=F7NDX0_9FIRM|nr:hypothetical protein ALO_01140 [Acetonema longum DSM 6540]